MSSGPNVKKKKKSCYSSRPAGTMPLRSWHSDGPIWQIQVTCIR